ncbi:MAG: hypothetical protein AAF485_01180 [Chloroflexota bacterium]
MAIDVQSYNKQFLEKVAGGEPIYDDAGAKYGVEVRSLQQQSIPLEAESFWRVIGIHHLTGAENMGNHNVFCDVLDENGQRINHSRLVLTQGTASPVFAVVDKPANEPGTNFPIFKGNVVTVGVESDLPSEQVTGIHIGHADEEVGNTWGHHSFYVVFQRCDIKDAETNKEKETVDTQTGESGGGGTEAPLTLEETIALAGQPLIIPLNPEAMFYKIAQEKGLGERLTSEYDAEYQGKTYRAQTYENGIVYAEVGDWGNVKIIPRTN